MSNLLRQVSCSLLYIIGQGNDRRGLFYSYDTLSDLFLEYDKGSPIGEPLSLHLCFVDIC